MTTLNSVTLIGHLGRDPEFKQTQQGLAVCNITIATQEHSKGEQKATWHNVTAFGKTAEFINQYFKKGMRVLVAGRIDNTTSEKDGKKVHYSKVIADKVQFMDSKADGKAAAPATRTVSAADSWTDEVPF